MGTKFIDLTIYAPSKISDFVPLKNSKKIQKKIFQYPKIVQYEDHVQQRI
jgi:hypothetical protein